MLTICLLTFTIVQPAPPDPGNHTRTVEDDKMKIESTDAKMVRVLFAEKMILPERDVPKEARQQRSKVDELRVPFSKLIAGNISSVTATYFNTKTLKNKKDAENFLRLLLTTPNGAVHGYIPWAQSLGLPTVTATVEHVQGNTGTWLVWGVDQGALCAYKDGAGRWWFGVWSKLK